MTIHVTRGDIHGAGCHPINNPITRAIVRVTRQTWIVADGQTAYRLSPPPQTVKLPRSVLARWQRYQNAGLMRPFSFELASDHLAQSSERREHRAGDRRIGERRHRTPDRRRTG